jgi:hypothetical protein
MTRSNWLIRGRTVNPAVAGTVTSLAVCREKNPTLVLPLLPRLRPANAGSQRGRSPGDHKGRRYAQPVYCYPTLFCLPYRSLLSAPLSLALGLYLILLLCYRLSFVPRLGTPAQSSLALKANPPDRPTAPL